MSIDENLLYERLAGQIRARREDLGKTQAAVADQVGVLRTSINNIEKMRQKPPLHLVYRIAEALEVEVDDLLPLKKEVMKEDLVPVNVNGQVRRVPPRTAEALRRAVSDLEEGR